MRVRLHRLRWVGKVITGVGKILFLTLLLILLCITQEMPRNWVLHHIAQQTGWVLSIEQIAFSWSPAQISGHHLALVRPDGLILTLQRVTIGLDPRGWLSGRLSSIELEKPHLQLAEETPDPTPPSLTSPPLIPPLMIDHLRINNGSLTWPATGKRATWHLQNLSLVGENLSPDNAHVTFSATTIPAGKMRGNLSWNGTLNVEANAEAVEVAPLLALLGVTAHTGVLQAHVTLHMDPDGTFLANSAGRLDRLTLANGWEGSGIWSLNAQNTQQRLHLEGLARSTPQTPFAPTRLDATLNHEKTTWTIGSLQAEIQPYLHLTGHGELFPHLNQQINLTLSQPEALAQWGNIPWHSSLISLPNLHWQGQLHGSVAGLTAVEGWLSQNEGRLHTQIIPGEAGRWRLHLTPDDTFTLQTIKTLLPPEWSLDGAVAGKITLDALEEGWSGHLHFTVQQLKLSRSAPSSLPIMGEHVNGTLQGDFLIPPDTPPQLNGVLSLHTGEWLVGSYYGEMGSENLEAQFFLTGGPSWSVQTTVHAKTLPTLQGQWAPSGKGVSGEIQIQNLDLERLFHTYLLEAWGADHPEWKSAKLGGRLGTDLQFDWIPDNPPRLSGWLSLEQGNVVGPGKKWGAGKITLSLPLAREKKPGVLRLEELQIQDVPWPTQTVELVWHKETLKLVGELAGPLLGGTLQLDTIQIAHPWSPERSVSLALKLTEGEINRFNQQMGFPPLEGRLYADFSEMVWQKEQLQTKGTLSAQLFSGTMRMENLSVQPLFSGIPTWQTDIELTRMDLKPLSQWLNVGLIEGTLSGRVDELVMAGAEPLSFSATLATEEGEGNQRISLKAIENIQTLGSGGRSGLLQQGLVSLFDSFGYRQIGFQCRLKNDTFYLRGVTHREGKEYLVVGSFLPPRVDVVSHNPVIGWRDMVDRIQRITTTPTTEEPSEHNLNKGERTDGADQSTEHE